jgi:lysyl-tRNA synthetase class 2
VLASIRGWLHERGYLEVPTPVRVPSPALEENLFALSTEGGGYLRTSPEFALKRVLAAGLCRVYEIGPCLRGREAGPWHGTEFTMLEFYRVGADLDDLMDEVEALVATAFSALGRPPPPRWERLTVRQLVQQATGHDLATATAEDLVPGETRLDHAFYRVWIESVEPLLRGGVFVRDWPASEAALSAVRDDGEVPVALRFEAYLDGVELGNAFQELTDGEELRRRFAASAEARRRAGESPHPVDEALIEATSRLPRTAGIAIGVDRLVAAAAGWSAIHPGRVDWAPPAR